MHAHALFLFRKDLRLEDNTGLIAAAKGARKVSVGFIFDPMQVGKGNHYKSLQALRFLLQSLEEIKEKVQEQGGVLNIWHGPSDEILASVLKHSGIDAVFVNADYTPFARARDEKLAAVCASAGIAFQSFHDALLNPPGSVLTSQGQFFKVFTAFYKKAQTLSLLPVAAMPSISWAHTLLSGAHTAVPSVVSEQCKGLPDAVFEGGRKAGLATLKRAACLKEYTVVRDQPFNEKGTSHLSPHLKFGTVSVREVVQAFHSMLGALAEPLVRSLYWRDFFCHVAFGFPFVFGSAFQQQYNALSWSDDEKAFERWCSGATGFPLVDAGMRQLNATGYMHNRVRMVVASFLVKDLHINWQWGEKYFAQKLVDYDPAVNNGNWQWAASTGCDAQPYFRIFNPWLQQKKFDPGAVYIKRWVPELAPAAPAAIHAHFKRHVPGYVPPMVDHSAESKKALAAYKKVASAA